MANVAVLKKALLTARIATGTDGAVSGPAGYKTYSASGTTSAGTGAATIVIEGSMNGGVSWDSTPIGTITLTLGTSATSDGFTSTDRYEMIRARITAISGTNASVDCAVGF